jgi:hypothetical protein
MKEKVLTYDAWFQGITEEQRVLTTRILGDLGTLGVPDTEVKKLLQESVKVEAKEEVEEEKEEEKSEGKKEEKPKQTFGGPLGKK